MSVPGDTPSGGEALQPLYFLHSNQVGPRPELTEKAGSDPAVGTSVSVPSPPSVIGDPVPVKMAARRDISGLPVTWPRFCNGIGPFKQVCPVEPSTVSSDQSWLTDNDEATCNPLTSASISVSLDPTRPVVTHTDYPTRPTYVTSDKTGCTHNAVSEDEWWEVTFRQPKVIDTIRIYNRPGGDCCSDRLQGSPLLAQAADNTSVFHDADTATAHQPVHTIAPASQLSRHMTTIRPGREPRHLH
ncbi:hypothetical protein EGW08_013203 [Elysia chlorotica]|uniref:F5/8 type C domain-containing protein n=1 Tax=Elysia chlorotica TaxID=188477 RepID=A0A3S1BEN4_ELYCH|nr:hypothetical protein EGW08_013203 [Elysia chlorotica]